MNSSMNLHGAKSVKVSLKPLHSCGRLYYRMHFIVTGEDGRSFDLTLFSNKPLPIEGAEHVNFVAQPLEEPPA